jgi:HD domain-containing protein/GAF domain-containing protein
MAAPDTISAIGPTALEGPPGAAPVSLRDREYRGCVLDRIAEYGCEVLGVEQSCVFVRDAGSNAATLAASCGLGERGGAAPDGDLIDLVLALGEPVVVTRGSETAELSTWGSSGVTDAHAAAPITFDGVSLGALSASSTRPTHRFAPRDLRILCELADFAAAALDHEDVSEELERLAHTHVEALASSIAVGEGYTTREAKQVVLLAVQVGEAFGLGPIQLLELEFAARVRDVGKIGIPDAVLHNPGPLDRNGWKLVRSHPVWSAETLGHTPGLEAVASVVQFHHERWDGNGYPDGLERERIPLPSRIILACEAYVAMTAERPYRPALAREHALEELRDCAGSQFDPDVVQALIGVVESGSSV